MSQLSDADISWIICGQQTPIHQNIPVEWVAHITDKADREHVPIFLKNNLKPLMGENLRQEWPEVKHG